MNAWIPLAFLRIPPKRLVGVVGYTVEQQELDALQVIHEIISRILSPLSDAASRRGIQMVCCDEKVRRCVPRLTCWLADHMENAILHCVATNRCPSCIAPVGEFGEIPNQAYNFRSHPSYAAAYENKNVASLREWEVKDVNNAFWHIPNLYPHELVKPDILHTLLLGMLEHLMKWVMEFLSYVGRTTTFDYIWSRLPPYPGFTRPNKAYRSVSQCQGKEMRNRLRVILAVFTAALDQTSDVVPIATQYKVHIPKAILCVRYLTDFIALAQYRVHTLGSIKSIQDYLSDFHKHKDVFLRFRATKAAKNSAREASKDMRSEQKLAASDVTHQSKRRMLEKEFRVETEEVVNDILSGGGHFNFPKMHLISHFADQINKYGTLTQYSTEICEALHKPLKDAYRRSNYIDTLPQIISTYARGHSFVMREKNLEQWGSELGHIPEDIRRIVDPTRNSTRTPAGSSPSNLTVKLLGRIDNGAIYNLETLDTYYSLPDLQMLTSQYLNSTDFKSSPDLTSEVAELINAPFEAFRTL